MNQPPPVRALTVTYNGRSSVLQSPVDVSAIHLPGHLALRTDFKRFQAIWDTGATNTVITKKVVDELGLQPIGVTEVHTPSDTVMTDVCIVDIGLPNQVLIQSVKVTVGKPFGCDLLIGMDIIGLGDFAVSNFQGLTTFTFRMPSCEKLDFVNQKHEPFVRAQPKVGRNDECPCGSHKKYKDCHGK